MIVIPGLSNPHNLGMLPTWAKIVIVVLSSINMVYDG